MNELDALNYNIFVAFKNGNGKKLNTAHKQTHMHSGEKRETQSSKNNNVRCESFGKSAEFSECLCGI